MGQNGEEIVTPENFEVAGIWAKIWPKIFCQLLKPARLNGHVRYPIFGELSREPTNLFSQEAA